MRNGLDRANRLAGVAANANNRVDQVLFDGDVGSHDQDFIVRFRGHCAVAFVCFFGLALARPSTWGDGLRGCLD